MKKLKALRANLKKKLLVLSIIVLLTIFSGYLYFLNTKSLGAASQNKYQAFISEIYDKIKENYWEKITDEQLIDLFKQSIEKTTESQVSARISTRKELLQELSKSIQKFDEGKKEEVVPKIAGIVLASLQPFQRSGLYTEKLEAQLKNTVENINPEKDLYNDLGLNKGSSEKEVEKAYEQKKQALETQNTDQAKEELKKIAYAKEVLTEVDKKQRYDAKGVEPAIFSRIRNNILYIQFNKFSPTAFDEFIKVFETNESTRNLTVEVSSLDRTSSDVGKPATLQSGFFRDKDNASLYGLILDLRGNVGGAIDATAYFLGLFLGPNQYGYEFYHQGTYEPFKTTADKLPSLAKYRQIVILIDNQTQSSAEILAASLKKYRVGVVVGTPTKGWGTVERVFPIEHQISEKEKYSVFLVHSITLRDDNLPIEGRGVEPDINIKEKNWQNQLYSYFNNRELVNTVKLVL